MKKENNTFEQYLISGNKSSKTRIAYLHDIEQFTDYLKETSQFKLWSKHITAKVLMGYINHLTVAEGLSASSVRRKMSSLGTYYKYYSMVNGVFINPLYGLPLPKIKRTLPKPIAENEALDALESVSCEDKQGCIDKVILLFLWGLGLRREEVRTLKFSNISEDYVVVTGKGDKERKLPIPEIILSTVKKLKDYYQDIPQGKNTGHILQRGNGGKVSERFIYDRVKKLD